MLSPFINRKSKTHIGRVSFPAYARVSIWTQDKSTFQDTARKWLISLLMSLRSYFKFLGMKIWLTFTPVSVSYSQEDKSHRTTTVVGTASYISSVVQKGWGGVTYDPGSHQERSLLHRLWCNPSDLIGILCNTNQPILDLL